MNTKQLLAFGTLMIASAAWGTSPRVEVRVGESIGQVRLGMTRREVQKLGYTLIPDQVDRGGDRGFTAGALVVVFESLHDTVVSVAVELKKTSGLKIGSSTFPARGTMKQLARLLPTCPVEDEGLGLVLSCPGRSRMVASTEGDGPVVQVLLSR